MQKITQAMILSAGLGTRMGVHTKEISKSMLLVDGVSLIERHLNYLYKNGIFKVVINTFYKAEILENFIMNLAVAKKLKIIFSREDELLGTGGGVKNALSILGKDPFLVINNDAVFIDDDVHQSSIQQLEQNWNPHRMSILILLADKKRAFGYWGKGDFDINEHNQLTLNKESGEFIHAGMRIMDYRVFKNFPDKILQFITVYKDSMNQGKLYGIPFKGKWFHIGDDKAYETYKLD